MLWADPWTVVSNWACETEWESVSESSQTYSSDAWSASYTDERCGTEVLAEVLGRTQRSEISIWTNPDILRSFGRALAASAIGIRNEAETSSESLGESFWLGDARIELDDERIEVPDWRVCRCLILTDCRGTGHVDQLDRSDLRLW